MNFAVLICVIATLLSPVVGSIVMCYFASWSTYRVGNGNFQISDVEPDLCTHYIYTFIGIMGDGSINIMDEWNDLPDNGGRNNFANLVALKNSTAAPIVIVSIGGWNEGTTNFTIVVNNDTLRETFVTNIITFLKKYNFDGLDLDWQYPNQRGGQASDVDGFTSLMQELKAAFADDGFLLTAAVGATDDLSTPSYDIPELSKNLDYINVMTYDFYVAPFSDVVGHHAPLFAASYQEGNEDVMDNNINSSLNFWLSNGIPASKLVFGIPLYGRTFTLSNISQTTPGSPSSSPGTAGPYSGIVGSLGYNEFCEQELSGNWTTVWFDEQQVPYAYSGDQWVGFDNEESITNKINFIKDLGLSNIMFWSIDTDDFKGICGNKTYPLIKAASAALFNTTSYDDNCSVEDPI